MNYACFVFEKKKTLDSQQIGLPDNISNQVPKARRQDSAQGRATAPQSRKEAAKSRSEGNQEETETGEKGAAVEWALYLRQSQPD